MSKTWTQRLAAVLAVVSVAIAATGMAKANHDGKNDFEVQRLSGELSGKQFAAGPQVYLDAQVDDDVFAAGGEITARNLRAVDLFAAGALVDISDLDAADAMLGGGSVNLRGRLSGDLFVAGGSLTVESGTTVQGDALLAGGRVEFAGTLKGTLRAAAGSIRIDGTVEGPVELAGGHIALGPNAVVRGDLSYRSDDEIEMLAGAQVEGKVMRTGGFGHRFEPPSLIGLILFGVLSWLGVLVALVLLAAVLLALFPRLLVGASRTVYLRPLPAFALGVALAIVLPVGATVALATMVGIPVGLVALALFAVALAVGLVTTSLWIGARLPKLRNGFDEHLGYGWRLARAAAGLLVLGLVALVPFLGGLSVAVAIAFGLGGVALQGWALLGQDTSQG